MYSLKDLRAEIRAVIERGAGKVRIHSAWVACEVCAQHPLSDDGWQGDDREFWALCGPPYVQTLARAVIAAGKKRQEETIDEHSGQMDLPDIPRKQGFKFLQEAYYVSDPENPASEPELMPLGEMTSEQIQLKIDEKRRMAAGNLAHAKELERYLVIREAEAS